MYYKQAGKYWRISWALSKGAWVYTLWELKHRWVSVHYGQYADCEAKYREIKNNGN